MTENDEDLPRTLAPAEWNALIERHLSTLRYYVRLRVGPVLRAREPVSDIVQSTLREILSEPKQFEYTSDAAFRCWLYTIATHKIIAKNRYYTAAMRNAVREEALASAVWDLPERDRSSPEASPSRFAVHNEDLDRLQRAFEELDEDDRQILSMRKIFDIPASEIAKQLGIAESTVRWRLAQVLAKVASRLD